MNLKFEEICSINPRSLKILGRINPKRSTLRHAIIKLSKTEIIEIILTGAKKSNLSCTWKAQ